MIKFQLRKSTHDSYGYHFDIHRNNRLDNFFGSLIVALLAFLDKSNKQKNNAHPVGKQDGRLSLRGN